MFFAFEACHAGTGCAFLHDANNKYTGPPPRALKGKSKGNGKVTGAVALATFADNIMGAQSATTNDQPLSEVYAGIATVINKCQQIIHSVPAVPAAPVVKSAGRNVLTRLAKLAFSAAATTTSSILPRFGNEVNVLPALTPGNGFGNLNPASTFQTIEWIGDTGAGRNLGSSKSLPAEFTPFISESSKPVAFATGGGAQSGTQAVRSLGGLTKGDDVYVLPKCPNALSTGIQVNKHKRPFLWLLNELPFFIKEDRLKDCTIVVPKDARIEADRVEENVPIFKDKMRVTYAAPASSVEPETLSDETVE
jgi:hypothetical protein